MFALNLQSHLVLIYTVKTNSRPAAPKAMAEADRSLLDIVFVNSAYNLTLTFTLTLTHSHLTLTLTLT